MKEPDEGDRLVFAIALYLKDGPDNARYVSVVMLRMLSMKAPPELAREARNPMESQPEEYQSIMKNYGRVNG